MPRLQILHHKSYHPYNEKNKQRVREDEAKARAEELAKEQRRIDAESEERLNLLRRRAGSPGAERELELEREPVVEPRRDKESARERRQRERLDFDFPSETKKRVRKQDGPVPEEHDRRELEERFQSGGHLNFWADLESGHKPAPTAPPTAAELAKRKAEQEADKFTMYLGRPDRETKPWYTDRELKRVEEKEGGDDAEYRRARDRRRDVRSKDRNDPLTDINKSLAAQRPSQRSRPRAGASSSGSRSGGSGSTSGMSERERAMALLAKKSSSTGGTGRKGWESPSGDTWHDALERQKDTAGNRYHSDTWDRRRGREY